MEAVVVYDRTEDFEEEAGEVNRRRRLSYDARDLIVGCEGLNGETSRRDEHGAAERGEGRENAPARPKVLGPLPRSANHQLWPLALRVDAESVVHDTT